MEKNLKEIIFEKLDPTKIARIESNTQELLTAIGLVARLRGPHGCPWDQKQDHLSLRPYLIEEAYEVLDALDEQNSPSQKSNQHLCEELGDLLLQILLHSELSSERGEFTVGDVASQMTKKIVHRHPHVFGDVKVSGADEVLKNWESLKKKEGRKFLLDGIPKNLPSLQKASRIGEKAHRIQFDWKTWQEVWKKVEEELQELKEAICENNGNVKNHIEEELGDMFFTLCQLARHLKIEPEDAHRKAIQKFEKRFRKMEEFFEERKKDIHSVTSEELETAWENFKNAELT